MRKNKMSYKVILIKVSLKPFQKLVEVWGKTKRSYYSFIFTKNIYVFLEIYTR